MIKKFINSVFYIITALLFITSSIVAQDGQFAPHREISRDSLLTYARMIIDSSRTYVFITVDETDKPQARQMSPFPPEENWVIWLGTFPTSRKAKQIQNNPNVIVYYYDSKGMGYISVSGKARLVNDPDLKAKYWKSGWSRFYPDRDKQYILIEVTPKRLEICSFKYDILWNEEGRPFFVEFDFE